LSGLIAAALFAMTPALVQPTTAGFFNHHVIGLPLVMLAVLCYAIALRRCATPTRLHSSASSSSSAFSSLTALTQRLPRFVFSPFGGLAAFVAVCAQHSWSHGIWLPQIVAAHTAVLLALGVRATVADGVFESFVTVYALMCGSWTFRLSLENVPLLLVGVWSIVARFVPRLRLHAPLVFAVWCAAPLVAHLFGALSLDAPASGTLARNGLGWLALFRDFHVPLFAVPAGLQHCLSQATSVTLFFAVYAAVALLLVSGSESMTLFAAPALCVVSAAGISAIARGYMLSPDAVAFRRRPRAVSKESVTSIVLFLLLMTTFFVVYAWTSAMHRVVLRPSIAVHAVPTNDEALETVAWVRANTNRTASILAYPDSDSFRMVLASDRRFHVSNLNPGAMPRNPSNTYSDEIEYFRTRRIGDAFDAAAVLLSPEDTAWSVMRELGGAYLLVRCSPFDTSEYSMVPPVDDATTAAAAGESGAIDSAASGAAAVARCRAPTCRRRTSLRRSCALRSWRSTRACSSKCAVRCSKTMWPRRWAPAAIRRPTLAGAAGARARRDARGAHADSEPEAAGEQRGGGGGGEWWRRGGDGGRRHRRRRTATAFECVVQRALGALSRSVCIAAWTISIVSIENEMNETMISFCGGKRSFTWPLLLRRPCS
jgi:hypothetical protein